MKTPRSKVPAVPAVPSTLSALAPFRRHALYCAAAILLLTVCLMPIASQDWPELPAFLPVYHSTSIAAYGLAAYLLSRHYRQSGARALLWLCGGSLFTAAMLLLQFLSFDAALVPGTRLASGIQTPAWLWILWHLGATGMLLAYALEEWLAPGRAVTDRNAAFLTCLLLTASTTLAAVLAVTLFQDYLPTVEVAGTSGDLLRANVAPLLHLMHIATLLLLWRASRFATRLSAWLAVAVVALAIDTLLTTMGGARLSAGWYGGRIGTMLAALCILVAYLTESGRVVLAATRAADRLAEENTRLRAEHAGLVRLLDQAPGFVALVRGPKHTFQFANAAFSRLTAQRALVGHPLHLALPELRGHSCLELIDKVAATGQPQRAEGMRLVLRRTDGAVDEVFVDVYFQAEHDADGGMAGIAIHGSDVSARVLAQQAAAQRDTQRDASMREHASALTHSRAALLQAQKQEAIGKLTGSVAHDFNNVLHIISGNIDLIKMFGTAHEKILARCHSAQSAVQRGARLSSQLLEFARKQPQRPNAVALGDVFANMDLLIKHAVGEKVDVLFDIAPTIWNVKVDPQQLESVVLNLALNAGEALKRGGELRIAARNVILSPSEQAASGVAASHCVRLAFADNGDGMSEAVRQRAVEPFFSTRGAGKGSGLGLSMASAFVQQCGGQIEIDSTLGAGTAIVLCLPRTGESATPKKRGQVRSVEGGDETVLVVDDEKEIRENVAALLSELGYQVITASSADEAATLLDRPGRIDLLFTDVIMPGAISCMELAAMARVRHPALRVLFTSGDSENAVPRQGTLDESVTLLNKPYAREELAGAVRKLLSARSGSSSAGSSAGTSTARQAASVTGVGSARPSK